jgi:GH24 family phage-related lysozyme (muramidase)
MNKPFPSRRHPGKPQGSDTVPAWLTPGEFVMNAEAARMFSPEIQAMNDRGRAVQAAQGGTIPQMGGVPIPTTHNPSAAYSAGGGVGSEEPAWKQHIRTREGGLKRKIYIDTEGYATVGIGHKLPDSYKSQEGQSPFSDSELNNFFEADIAQATANAQHNVSSFNTLTVPQQGGLINQAFQLGRTGQSKFKNMIKAINEGNMTEAGAQALDSKWNDQTPKRSTDLSRVLQGQETKMEYNRGGAVPQYLGFGDWVRSLWSDDEDESIFSMPESTSLSGTPDYMFGNKHNYISPPQIQTEPLVQTEINTDGSYFNQPYGTDSDRMDSNFKVPEPPKYSDAALENNSSKALQDVPYASLPDPDLGALITQGDKTAEAVMKARANKARVALEYGEQVPRGDAFGLGNIHSSPNNKDHLQKGQWPTPPAPREVLEYGKQVPRGDAFGLGNIHSSPNNKDHLQGAGVNLPQVPNALLSLESTPTMGPGRNAAAHENVLQNVLPSNEQGKNFIPPFERPDDPTFKKLTPNARPMSMNQGRISDTLGAPMEPVNVDANDPRIGVPEYYGVPKTETTRKRFDKPEDWDPVTDLNLTEAQQLALEKEQKRIALENEFIGKTGLHVDEDGRQDIYDKKVKEAEEFIATGSEEAFANAKNEKERLEVVKKISDSHKLLANSKEKARIEENKALLLKSGEDKRFNSELDNKISALQKELGTATNDKHKDYLNKKIAELQGKKVDTTDKVFPELTPIVEGGNGDKNLEAIDIHSVPNSLVEDTTTGNPNANVIAEGNKAPPEAKDAAIDQIKGIFGDMFDPKELMRMAILYLGARATGASGGQAMAFAGKHYLKRIDQKHSTNKFNKHFNELNASNNYTEDSMKLYKYLRDPNVLVAKSSNAVSYRRPDPAGEDYYLMGNTPGIRKHEKIYLDDEYRDGKKTGNKVYRNVNGDIISPAALQNYTKDKSFDKKSKEYEESVLRIQKQWEGMVNTRLDTYKPTGDNEGKPKMFNLLSKNPTVVARQIALFQKDVLMNTGQNLDSTIVENAFNNIEKDISKNRLSKEVSQVVFGDYLNDAYIKAKVGHNTYFKHGKGLNETDKATAVNQTMDSLVEQVKRHGEGKWKDTPPIVINNLIMNQAKLDYQALKQRPTEYAIFQEQYNKAYKGNKQSELLYYLNNELLESTIKQVADFDSNFKKV